MDKILTINQLSKLNKLTHNKKVVLVGGCFDILHIGHITFLEKAKQKGDLLIVLLESDESIRKSKGRSRPINFQNIRAKILSSLESVDYVVLLPFIESNQKYDELVQKLKPDILATTRGDKGMLHKKRQAKKIEAKLITVTEKIKDQSTTKIARLISQYF
jgi:FAD synthetase